MFEENYSNVNVCTNCKKSLYKDLQQIALDTLKCGKCGEIIITENNTSQ